MTRKRKDKKYYQELASKHARAAKTSQMKLKSYKEGFEDGLKAAREARNV